SRSSVRARAGRPARARACDRLPRRPPPLPGVDDAARVRRDAPLLRAGRAAGLPLLPLAPREDLAGRELRAPEGAGAACRPGPRLGRRDARRAARAAEGVRAAAGARARRRGRALQPGRAPAERGVGAGRLGADAPRRLLAAPAADGLAVAAAR